MLHPPRLIHAIASAVTKEWSLARRRVGMKATFFAALSGASILMAGPAQAQFIGIAIRDPQVMLPICKNEIAQGRAGVCTGYVVAKMESMHEYSSWVPHDALCIPGGTEYKAMVQVVVSWAELNLIRDPEVARFRDFRVLTEGALRNTWGCKK